jgi:hypothetical protein
MGIGSKAVVAAVFALLTFGTLGAGEAGAATRYARATAGATTGPCTAVPPAGCDLQYAIDVAAPSDVVEVGPGTYQQTAGYTVAKAIVVRGAGGGRPVLTTPADTDDDTVLFVTGAATIDNLAVQAPDLDVGVSLNEGAAMTNSVVTSSADELALESGRGSQALRNSVVFNRSTGDAVQEDVDINQDNASATGSLALRNVTAVAAGAGAHAVTAFGSKGICNGCSSSASVTAVNTIARSPASELRTISFTGTAATITATFSNFRTVEGAGVSGPTANQGGVPAFANLGAGDFHQLAGSPTIDAGSDDGQLGSTDFDGQARINGLAPDIGADEYYAPVAGPVTAASAPAVPDRTKPRTTALTLSPPAFLAAGAGGSVAAARTGTTVGFRLSEAARLRFTVDRRVAGRRVGRRCVAQRRSNRTKKRCARYTGVRGSFSLPGKTGKNGFHFTGRLRGAKLRPGRYRLAAAATDPSGNRGTRVRAAFRIKKP